MKYPNDVNLRLSGDVIVKFKLSQSITVFVINITRCLYRLHCKVLFLQPFVKVLSGI